MKTIGRIFVDQPTRRTIGEIRWDRNGNPILRFDPVEILPVARECRDEKIRAACKPFDYIESPPFMGQDIQYTGLKKKRIKMGYVYTDEDERGILYQVRLYTELVLKRYNSIWLHLH